MKKLMCNIFLREMKYRYGDEDDPRAGEEGFEIEALPDRISSALLIGI